MSSTTCSAVGCTNNPVRNPELWFHQFPRDRKGHKVWVGAVRRIDFGPRKTVDSELQREALLPALYVRHLHTCRLRKASASKTRENLGVLPAAYLFPRCSTDSHVLSRTLTSDYPRNHVRLERREERPKASHVRTGLPVPPCDTASAVPRFTVRVLYSSFQHGRIFVVVVVGGGGRTDVAHFRSPH
ncbi:hypothetical protein HPB47_019326 [Ixodes persulcatus]|uniref:Uncharacterized protein n=1 Tax=Ixodes persulcatus TaxID=34615 RepID=A0AC60QII6_IXOPE|nr:hypothetical protein HPB47_019326 [Ixodes persulcatus]